MGMHFMGEREFSRLDVLLDLDCCRISVADAMQLLRLGRSQVFRLLAGFRRYGSASLISRRRGRPGNNQLPHAVRELAMTLVREHYADFGPTLAAEKLVECHGCRVSRETLRQWMIADGIWQDRARRLPRVHQPRNRRERLGELVQIDGSKHWWFEDRGPQCTLIAFIDDATSRIMHGCFVPSESTFDYLRETQAYIAEHGRPIAFYSDKHAVFRVNRAQSNKGDGMTQFTRALHELNVDLICANSPQAKGRIERCFGTLQDRLVKEMRLEGIDTPEAGNAWLPGYIQRHNTRFARTPARPDNLHRAVTETPDRLNDILCWRDERYVGQQLTFSYERKRVMLEETEVTRSLVGKYVDTYAWADGRFDVRWKGHSLPYRVFDPDQQRITHAAITENKHLGATLAYAKALQEAASLPAPKIGKQRTRYQPTGRKPPGRPPLKVKPTFDRAAIVTPHAAE